MLSGKEFRKYIFSLIGEHPYTWAKNNGIKNHVIDQLKRPKIPGLKILNILSDALGKDVDELVGKKSVKKPEDYNSAHLNHSPRLQEYTLIEKHREMVIKLVEILEGANRVNAEAIEQNLNAFHQTKDVTTPVNVLTNEALLRSLNHEQWLMAGRPERRKVDHGLPLIVKSERRSQKHVNG